MSSLNKETVNTVSNIMGLKASPVTIANAVKSATEGEISSAGLGALSSLQAFAGVMSKTAERFGGPLLVATTLNDVRLAVDQLRTQGYVDDNKILDLASDAAALM